MVDHTIGCAVQILPERITMPNTVTKKELQDTLDEVGIKVSEMLNPAFSREEIIVSLQELDEIVNGSDDDDPEADDSEEDEDEEA
jgi:hypothetical protein